MLEQGGSGWRNIAVFLRLAVIYRLMAPEAVPLVVSARWMAAHLRTKPAAEDLSLMEVVSFSLIRRRLSLSREILPPAKGEGMGGGDRVQHDDDYRLQRDDPYEVGYNRHDPAVHLRMDDTRFYLFPSLSAALVWRLVRRLAACDCLEHRMVLRGRVDVSDDRYLSLMSDGLTGQDVFAVGCRLHDSGSVTYQRVVMVSGFRPDDTIVAYIKLYRGGLKLYTTEPCVGDASCPLDERLPTSMGLFRRVLGRFGLEKEVIDGGRVTV
mmetsp:Transcript_5045/g.13728  ORF Transcript_5045/g.13728 Transcript_5045/m.13728 type:complete len:266 (-) Transcript_5045:911-1708(-)